MGVDFGNIPATPKTVAETHRSNLISLLGVSSPYSWVFQDFEKFIWYDESNSVAGGGLDYSATGHLTGVVPAVGIGGLSSAASSGSGRNGIIYSLFFLASSATKWGTVIRAAWPACTANNWCVCSFNDGTYQFGVGHVGGTSDAAHYAIINRTAARTAAWAAGAGSATNSTISLDTNWHTFYLYALGDGKLRLREQGSGTDAATTGVLTFATNTPVALQLEFNTGTDASANTFSFDYVGVLTGA